MLKYKKNLKIEGDKVWSYTTHVATIKGNELIVHSYWSVTTSKHINHVADVYGLKKVEGKSDEGQKEERDDTIGLKNIAMVAKMGDILCEGKKEKNDWKARMIKAGLENRGLIMPDDWDSLSEDEKERRLNGAIKELA